MFISPCPFPCHGCPIVQGQGVSLWVSQGHPGAQKAEKDLRESESENAAPNCNLQNLSSVNMVNPIPLQSYFLLFLKNRGKKESLPKEFQVLLERNQQTYIFTQQQGNGGSRDTPRELERSSRAGGPLEARGSNCLRLCHWQSVAK